MTEIHPASSLPRQDEKDISVTIIISDHGSVTKSAEKPEQDEDSRDNWTGRFDFLLSCLGYAVGLGNVWRFPYKCYENGGGAFFIPYLIMMVFVGMPLFFLELGLGQFTSSGPTTCWKYCPIFGGIGLGMVAVSAMIGIYYNMIIAWAGYYLVMSFTKIPNLPWDNCDNSWNSDECFDRINPCINLTKNDNGRCETLNGVKGVKSSGKVVYVTAIAPYIVLIILFGKGMTLDGMGNGVKFYVTPKWEKLKEAKVWYDAARFVIFAYLGHMAHRIDRPVDEVVDGGTGLAFIVYPFAVTELPGSVFWAIAFFFMLILLGLDSQFALLETITTSIQDQLPNFFKGKKKTFLIMFISLLLFLVGLFLCTQGGPYILELLNTYVGGWSIITLGICETSSLMYIYKWKKFSNDLHVMLGKKPWIWWRIMWSFVTPAIMLFVMIFSFIDYSGAKFGSYIYPNWANGVGWCLTAIVVVLVPAYAIYFLVRLDERNLLEKLKVSIRPTKDWGPRLNENRRAAGYDPIEVNDTVLSSPTEDNYQEANEDVRESKIGPSFTNPSYINETYL
ncbi:DgyrCDS801 [Dimorphilus gyrociliatus]|uniref:Transporter n=1 Tax=Dimorphilus gyrociliatus TaxID=2664684 RepID=A0A7I8V5E4_9ANNE|nr:DgyrCDS801 [Dimorphilus gyrociliatus]